MEFNFPINLCFKNEITKVGSRLLPEDFYGDRREVQECISRLSSVMTALGESSAQAQGLQKVITSGDKLRNSDHTVYVLADPSGGTRGYGSILGMLKVGVKHLYLFDSSGNNHEVYTNCILDFYVHESKQRMGLGKKLFEYMLQEESVEPQHMAIDKPSPKLLSFLHKHYGLETIIPQMNNFVLFEGFFDNRNDGDRKEGRDKVMAAGLSSSASRTHSGGLGKYTGPSAQASRQPPPPSPSDLASPYPYGRHAAHHPVSTMGLILQNQPPTQVASPSASRADSVEPPTPESLEPEAENIPEPEPQEQPEEVEQEPEIEAVEQLTLEEADQVGDPHAADPLPCKIQAGTAPHLDLKFYHSSLW